MNKVIYNTTTGEIRYVGSANISPGIGESSADSNADIPYPLYHYIFQSGNYVLKNSGTITKLDNQKNFNPDIAKASLYTKFQSKLLTVAPYYGVIGDLLIFKNFSALLSLAQGMLQANIINAQDLTDFKQVFLDQNVDLDNL